MNDQPPTEPTPAPVLQCAACRALDRADGIEDGHVWNPAHYTTASSRDLFALMRRLAGQGVAIILYSSEENELLDNCDRVMVFNGGRVVAELAGATLDTFHLTRAAYGDV